MDNLQQKVNEQGILSYYQKTLKSKICREIRFEEILDEKQMNLYKQYQKPSCCIKPLSLLIFSVIIFIFTFVGFFFSISKNEGYKAYKEVIEKNISLIDNEFPHEHETLKLINFLCRNKSEDNECAYLLYSLGLCTKDDYKNYCTPEKFNEGKCNYMDSRIHIGYQYACTLSNYKKDLCSEIQYNDYLENTGNISYEHKINVTSDITNINMQGLSFEKIWCKIGEYDQPIYLSFLIFMIIFISLCIFDLTLNKKILTPNVKYYIVVSFYLIYHVIFRIYAVLFFILFNYGILVSFYYNKIFLNPSDKENLVIDPFINDDDSTLIFSPEDKLWKDKRLNAIIFSGISLILFILVWILSFYKKLLYKYLNFNFDERNKDNNREYTPEIIRNASIKVGKNTYNFGIRPNNNIYLKENRNNKKHIFKEIIFKRNIYYLKFNNLGLKEQLCWSEMNYPNIDEVLLQLGQILNIIFVICIILISMDIFKFDNDITYEYYLHLIDLGYKPNKYKNIKSSHELNPSIDDFSVSFHIILGIFTILFIGKFIFFGGFKNILFIWITICLFIIIALLNFAIVVFCIIGCICNFLGFLGLSGDDYIKFNSDMTYLQFIFRYSFYFFVFIFSLIEFIFNIRLISALYKNKNENQRLEIEKKHSEDKYKYVDLQNNNWALKVINNNPNLPKHLIYQKKYVNYQIQLDNEIVTIGPSSDTIFCMEQIIEETLDEKDKQELNNYLYKAFDTKRIISKIIFNIIISGVSFIFSIIAISYSFSNNKYYKEYRDYFNESDNININNNKNLEFGLVSILTGYTKFWCDFGNYEKSILVSFLVFIIIFLLFEIFSLLIHKNIIKLEYQRGFFYNFILLFNMAFYLIFKVFLPLFVFLLFLSCYIWIESPGDNISENYNDDSYSKLDKEWNNKKVILWTNIVFKLFLIIFIIYLIKIKYSIIYYINKNYEEDEDEDESTNKVRCEVNEVNTSLIINNKNYNARIKLNQILYLKQIGSVGKENIFRFKKVYIQNITNNFIYIRLGHNSVTDQISLAEWNYPDLNQTFLKLAELCNNIYIILFFSVPLFKMHIKDELSYQIIKLTNESFDSPYKIANENKPVFSDIFNIYGSFEKGLTESRFILYFIQIIIILLFMLKRIYFGGFRKLIYLTISLIFSFICIAQNIIYIILDFLVLIFTIFSLISYNKNKYNIKSDDMINAKLSVQLIINIIIFIFNIKLLKESITFSMYYNKMKKSLIKFNNKEDNLDEDKPNFKPLEFKYISLEGNICSIKEYKNNNLQRYLYYYNINIQKNNSVNNIYFQELKEKDIERSNVKINNTDKMADYFNHDIDTKNKLK